MARLPSRPEGGHPWPPPGRDRHAGPVVGVPDGMDRSLIRHPAAWSPLLASLVALLMVLGYAALAGVADHRSEHAPARLFQLLQLVQLPLIAWFAVTWLPRRPRGASGVLALQAAAWVIPVLAVLLLEGAAR
jgi:hypothetical protein